MSYFLSGLLAAFQEDPCIERYNETNFMADEEIFVLNKYFNIEPINTTVGEIQLFPGALKIDLKNNGALINSRPSQSG